MKHLVIIALAFTVSIVSNAQTLTPKKEDGKWGMTFYKLDSLVIPCEYDSLKSYKYGRIAAMKDGKWGYIDIQNKVVIPFQFDNAYNFSYSHAIVKINEKSGLIDLNGIFVLQAMYDLLSQQNQHIIYKKDNHAGLMDTLGNTASNIYDDIDYFYKGKIAIKKDDKWGSWEDGKEDWNDKDIVFFRVDLRPFYKKDCVIKSKDIYEEDEDGHPLISEKMKDEAYYCNDYKFIGDVYKNVVYPIIARENGIEGLTMTEFVVDEKGKIINIRVKKEIGGGCSEEVIRVLKNLPQWYQPAIKDNMKVKMIYRLPVRFKLQN